MELKLNETTKNGKCLCDIPTEYKSNIKGTAIQIEKIRKNDHSSFERYPENFVFQPFIILKLFTHEIRNFPTV